MANQKILICKYNFIKVDTSIKKIDRAKAENSGKIGQNEKSKRNKKQV